ncbi:head maturation protease, ClpP-related [Treponema saccharophilum]|uniref:head maturation protease, ClpP-related n=1 Tax=Treponema saccharophilum TaxID=165 RepID=UPI0038643C2A
MDIRIDKEIGESFWGDDGTVTADGVREALDSAEKSGGKELRLVIDSPGGSVWEGVSIYNILREFCRNHADWKIETYIQGMAASMASVIALAPSAVCPSARVVCEDNAAFMIHKAWSGCVGNSDDMEKEAGMLKRIDSLLVSAYARKTAKSEREILSMMRKETWLFGQEIAAAGFADEVVGNSGADGAETGGAAMARWDACRRKVRAMEAKAGARDFGAVALALFGDGNVPAKNRITEDLVMTIEEFRAQNPELFAQIADSARKEGAEKERARASRLLAMAEKAGGEKAREFALKCISGNEEPSDAAIVDAFMDFGAAARISGMMNADPAVPDVSAPKNGDAASAERSEYFDRLDKALFG